jgi:hypothetical protein
MLGSIKKANELKAEIPGSFIPSQFDNPDNPQSHILSTGPEIWEDTEGNIDVFVAGIGTGGTVSGTDASFPNGTGTFNIVDANTVDTLVLDVGTYSGVKVNGTSIGLANGINSIVKDTTLPSGQFGFTYTTFSNPTPQSVNFNIAATQFYQDAVAAAERRGIAEGESHFTLTTVYVATNGRYVTTVSGSSLPLSNFGNYTLYYKSGEDYYIAANTAHQWYYRDNNYGTDYYQSGGRHYYYDSIADSYYIKTS